MQTKTITFYLFLVAVVGVVAYGGNYYKQHISKPIKYEDDYEMVKKYLLNDSPLYGKNRPKIWIHTKYEINARKWKNFQSRNSTDLNQPYLILTVQSIINHCGNNFHICLIDDESFSKLIPGWSNTLPSLPEPLKSRAREIAMLELVYHFGGMVVPNSFLCTKNLVDVYQRGTLENKPFFFEHINRHSVVGPLAKATSGLVKNKRTNRFIPDIQMMGAKKHSEFIRHLIDFLKSEKSNQRHNHFTQHNEFEGSYQYILKEAATREDIVVIDGEYITIKTKKGKPILLEELMEEDYLDIDMTRIYGVLIPSNDILTRPKYQWFAILPEENILASNMILAKMFKYSMMESIDEYHTSTEINSILAI